MLRCLFAINIGENERSICHNTQQSLIQRVLSHPTEGHHVVRYPSSTVVEVSVELSYWLLVSYYLGSSGGMCWSEGRRPESTVVHTVQDIMFLLFLLLERLLV